MTCNVFGGTLNPTLLLLLMLLIHIYSNVFEFIEVMYKILLVSSFWTRYIYCDEG